MSRRIPTVVAAVLAAVAVHTTPASAETFYSGTNGTPIPINATPTSSAIEVSGLTGRVTRVTVSLLRLSHARADDADILLVSPDGKTSLVMSDNCSGAITNASWGFSQDAPDAMGFETSTCGKLFYRPSNVSGTLDVFPGAPPGPVSGLYRASFDEFIGAIPNGTWRLYVTDDDPSRNDGAIQRGWTLGIETAAADAVVPASRTDGVASPYPLTRAVSGMSGVIEDVDVRIPGVHHERPGDLRMLLAGPRGQRVLLMSQACRGSSVHGQAWTLDDEAPGPMPKEACADGGRYTPTSHDGLGDLPAPAPQEGYQAALSAFDATDPNGEWRLYVADSYPAEFDGFLKRFQIEIKTRPAAAVSFAQDAVTVAEGAKGQLTLTRPADGRGLGRGSVTVMATSLSATAGEDFEPVSRRIEFGPAQTTRTVSVQALTDAAAEPAEALAVTLGEPAGDAAVGTTATATVTISGNDPGTGGQDAGAGTDGADSGDGRGQPVDRQPPLIGRVRLSRAAFAPTGRAARGTTIRFSLSEPATVTLKVQHQQGRRLVPVGALRRSGRQGANRVAFTGRFGRRVLRRGSYRLTVGAVDAAGNRATAPPRTFRIVAGGK